MVWELNQGHKPNQYTKTNCAATGNIIELLPKLQRLPFIANVIKMTQPFIFYNSISISLSEGVEMSLSLFSIIKATAGSQKMDSIVSRC